MSVGLAFVAPPSDETMQHRPSLHCLGTNAYSEPAFMQFFRLYADRVPANLFDRLRYIIQVGYALIPLLMSSQCSAGCEEYLCVNVCKLAAFLHAVSRRLLLLRRAKTGTL